MHVSGLHTRLVSEKMSQCREDVYLVGTDLMAWHGRCVSIPRSMTLVCPHVYFYLWCVFVFDWCEAVGDARAVLNQTCIGSDTAEPMVWQACDRAALVLNDFLGSITLPKHWTCHLPFPISPSWSQSFTIHKWSTDCTPLFAQYRLITQRCWLAHTHTQIRQAHRHCRWKSKWGAEGVVACQEPLWLSCGKLQRLVFTSAPCPLMFCHWWPLDSDSICQGSGLKDSTLKVTEDMCH